MTKNKSTKVNEEIQILTKKAQTPTDTLGPDLKEIMLSVYGKQVEWARLLQVSKGTISHWFNNRYIPNPESAYEIYNLVNNVGSADAKNKLKVLYNTPLVHITPKYDDFRAYTLEEYCTKVIINRIIKNLKVYPEERSIEYYNQVSVVVNVFSSFEKKERKNFVSFLDKLTVLPDFREFFITKFTAMFPLMRRPTELVSGSGLKTLSDKIDGLNGFTILKTNHLKSILSAVSVSSNLKIRPHTATVAMKE